MSKDIKKALEHCIDNECVGCPNNEELGSGEIVCRARLLPDILEYISDLQHQLEVAEKALNEMAKYAIENNDLYDLVSDFNIENERYDEDHFGIDTCDVVDYFKEQVEKEVKGE